MTERSVNGGRDRGRQKTIERKGKKRQLVTESATSWMKSIKRAH